MQILQPYRDRIDALDDRIVDLLAERTRVIREVAQLKFRENIPSILQERVDQVRERAAARATLKGMDPGIVLDLYARLIAYSCDLEEAIKADLAQPNAQAAAV